MGMVVNAAQKPEADDRSGLAGTIIAAVGGLVGLAAWLGSRPQGTAKIARLVAITALVAHLALKCALWMQGERDPEKARPRAIGFPTAASLREHEPSPVNPLRPM